MERCAPLLQQIVPQASRLGVLESRWVREQQPQREFDGIGITRVGPMLDHPIDEDEYRVCSPP